MNNYCVYSHTNKINHKQYIGTTCQRPSSRYGKNGIRYITSPKFYEAILKYGWDNFEHKIIFKNLSKEEALMKEEELIRELDTVNNGYNINKSNVKGHKK